jgi:uncharacterized protein YbgA (DUF1722 family)/uncharacterized protein YbbK (DUF523 family)
MKQKILLGISSCLLGNEVRYDGGHKRDRYVTDTLSEYFEFTAYCPETAIGLGIPRPTIKLALVDDQVRLVDSKDTSLDYTDLMASAASSYSQLLTDISGYILKSKSPSCGMERVKLYESDTKVSSEGVGRFAHALMEQQPCLPIEEEGRLNDAKIRENFIERVFAYHRWLQMFNDELTTARLMDFHRQHKLTLLAHNEKLYRQMGPLVAGANAENLPETANRYLELFTEAMKTQASRNTHINVLQHIMGYLKQDLDSDDKAELIEIFDKYKSGEIPLIVPITLLRHHFRKHPDDYINEQVYLNPYPEELMLRNHV